MSLFFVIAMAVLPPFAGVTAQNRIDKWTTDNGLPQNSVTGLTQTPDGYIWFTTNEGLVRFDGVRFKVFNKSNTPEILSNRMLDAFADKGKKVWMSTEEGDILTYDKGVFNTAMKRDEVPPGGRSRFFDDPSGTVIFYVSYRDYRDSKISYKHFHYQGGKFVSLEIEDLDEDSFLILTDKEGALWFTNGKALRRFKDGKIDTFDLSSFSSGEINKVAYQDRTGSIWLGVTDGQKHFLLRFRDGRVDKFPSPAAPVSYFAEDSRGNLWISLFNQGVYRVDQKSVGGDGPVALEPVLTLDETPLISHGYLFPDREGGIWIGTNQGLVRVIPQNIRLFSKQQGLPEENVYPVYEDSDGRIWAGIWENSLVRYDGQNFKTFLRTSETYYPTSLFEDRSGRFWIGTSSRLYFLDGDKLVTFTEQAGFSGETEFSVISQDKDNNLWFGTNRGLSHYAEGQSNVLTQNDGLPDDYIIAFLQAHDGKIWVGTRGGLALIENGNIRAFTTTDGLASNYIRSLHEDADRVLWIGSYDGGLTRLKDGKFTRFTMKEGLSSNGVFCILEDDRGWFWMNSNQGIYRVRKQELNDLADGKTGSVTSIAYNTQDGLLSIEGNGGRQPAGIKSRNGRLWFPTARGIAEVDPDTVIMDPMPPPVMIEEIAIDREPIADGNVQSAISNQTEVVVEPGQSNLEINYTGISFINSGQVKFKYRLEGLEAEWNDVGTRRTAYYSHVPPGYYTFHVIAANRDGVWNTDGALIKVTVLPPFYRTFWFVFICLGALGFLVWAAYRYRVHQWRTRMQMQFDERLAERTRIAHELHDSLLQGVVSASIRLNVAVENMPGDSPGRAQFDRIIELMQTVTDEGRNTLRGLRSPRRDEPDRIEKALADLRLIPAGGKEINFRVMVEGTSRDLSPIARDDTFYISREAVLNSYRHSEAENVEVVVEYTARHLKILVRDDGKGIDPGYLRSGRVGHWGLTGMRERADGMGAKLKIWSRPGGGTEVELSIPSRVAYGDPTPTRSLRWPFRPLTKNSAKPAEKEQDK